MEFSRHPHVRAERLDQIASTLGEVYRPVSQALPPIIAEKLKQLECPRPNIGQLAVADAKLSTSRT